MTLEHSEQSFNCGKCAIEGKALVFDCTIHTDNHADFIHTDRRTVVTGATANKWAREIRKALQESCLGNSGHNIYVIPSEIVKHDPNAVYRISRIRVKDGILEGQSLTMGYWFAIQAWELR